MSKIQLPGNEPSDVLRHFIDEVSLVANNPRLSILIINSFLELMVNILIEAKLKRGKEISEDNCSYSYSTKMTLLYELGFIWKDELFHNMNILRDLRNRSAHHPFFKITENDFRRFEPMSIQEDEWNQIIQKLDITRIAGLIFVNLWNPYHEIYLEAFKKMQSNR